MFISGGGFRLQSSNRIKIRLGGIMMNRHFYLLVVLTVSLTACLEDGPSKNSQGANEGISQRQPELSEGGDSSSDATGDQESGEPEVVRVCSPGEQKSQSCSEQISNSQAATLTQTCRSDGQGYVSSTCQLNQCRSGFTKVGQACLPNCIASGQVIPPNQQQRRARYASEEVLAPNRCQVQFQYRTCGTDGTLSDWSGTYDVEQCRVVEAPPIKVAIDQRYFNPLVSEDDRWSVEIERDLAQAVAIGSDIIGEQNPLKLPIRVTNPASIAVAMAVVGSPQGFVVSDMPSQVGPNSSAIFHISADVSTVGERTSIVYFQVNGQRYSINLKANVK